MFVPALPEAYTGGAFPLGRSAFTSSPRAGIGAGARGVAGTAAATGCLNSSSSDWWALPPVIGVSARGPAAASLSLRLGGYVCRVIPVRVGGGWAALATTARVA